MSEVRSKEMLRTSRHVLSDRHKINKRAAKVRDKYSKLCAGMDWSWFVPPCPGACDRWLLRIEFRRATLGNGIKLGRRMHNISTQPPMPWKIEGTPTEDNHEVQSPWFFALLECNQETQPPIMHNHHHESLMLFAAMAVERRMPPSVTHICVFCNHYGNWCGLEIPNIQTHGPRNYEQNIQPFPRLSRQ